MENLYLLGILSTTHKLDGTIKLSTNFEAIEELKDMQVIAIKDNDTKLLTISEINNFNGKKALINFKDINSIDEAKKIISYKIYIRQDLIEEYETDSIIGYDVFEKNELIGKLVDIMETNAHDILVVEDENEKEILIPYISVFVKNIDDEKQKIDVELIEGMR